MKIITVNNYEDFSSDFPVSQDILPPLTEKDFNLSGLDNKIKNRLFQLLISHKSAFARSTVELSAAVTEHHRISLQHDYPIKCPIYKIPFNLRNEFRRQIADLEKAGIISKSNSQYNTPALFVKQKEKWRLVLDFRKLNEITVTQDFVIPTLDDILHEISGSNYFSALDMKSAFNQIPLHFADRHKTAFSTPDGDKYQFNRLCFGLKNSPKAFQSIAQEVLGDLLHHGALVYIDDIILFTKTIDEHFELLGRKFKVFTDHKPLAGFLSNKNPSSKILRWKLALEEFNYDIHYIRGSLNSVADHLSRYINNITIALPNSKDLINMQREDSVLSTIIQKIDQNDVSPQISNYFINGEGLLCHLSKRPSRSPRSNTTRKQDQEASHVELSTRATKQHHFDYKIGSLCFIKTPNIKSNLSPKLRPKFEGPYRVIERFSNVNYRVQHVEQLRKRFNTHVNRMIPFIKRFSYLHLKNLDDLQPDETEVKGIVPSPRYNLRARAAEEFLGVPLTPPKKGDAVPTPGRRQCTHKFIMIWDVFWEFPAFLGSHGPREDIPPLTSDQSEKLIVFRKRILSRIHRRSLRWFSRRRILYKGTLARNPRCSRRRRNDETGISTHVAVDQLAANYLEKAVWPFSAMWSRYRSSPSVVHCQFSELLGARWSTASKLASLWNCSAVHELLLRDRKVFFIEGRQSSAVQIPFGEKKSPRCRDDAADFVRDVEALMELRASWTSMGRTSTGFKQHRSTTTPNYCSAFSEITTFQTFFFLFSSIKTWTAVREPGVCESGVHEVPVEWKKSLFEFFFGL
ncbi:retrovirus-related Pol polyprotein from transposon 17.6 [Trichonephila clavipes]|nr:retrovirus-related Pol polyprotein from transposon 17.6 [Trichonephila clavipes]